MNILKCLVEFVGTFLMICVILGTNKVIPMAIAFAAVKYWGIPISGGFYNPALTISYYLRGNITSTETIIFILVQLLAAICAYFFIKNTEGLYKTSNM
jgi:glycerol uptake facilitator-like aquaporin